MYRSTVFTLPVTSIDTHLLVSDLQLTLPNKRIFAQAELVNRMLEAVGKQIHILRPHNLESMTISFKDATAQKRYFELGLEQGEALLTKAQAGG